MALFFQLTPPNRWQVLRTRSVCRATLPAEEVFAWLSRQTLARKVTPKLLFSRYRLSSMTSAREAAPGKDWLGLAGAKLLGQPHMELVTRCTTFKWVETVVLAVLGHPLLQQHSRKTGEAVLS